MDFVLTAIAVQSIGTCLVAFFLWQLGRAIRVRFVTSWALATFTFGVALGFLYLTVSIGTPTGPARAAFGVYMAACYLTVFLFWSGLREVFRNDPFAIRHLLRLAPLMAFASIAPWFVAGMRDLEPYHFLIQGLLFGAALADTRSRIEFASSSIGRPIVQSSLVFLVLLMFWHAFASFTRGTVNWSHDSVIVTVLFDALAELFLVFGMVILACEHVRDQLERNNRELLDAKTELETVARTDGLTGLLNRRAFEEWPQLHAGGPAGCVAAIDVNDLKKLNDTHLHAAGDAALKLVGRALMNRCRVTDPIFRIGGDEFAIIMPGGNADELARRLEAIDGELENLRLPGVPGPYSLRIAWGVAGYSPSGDIAAAFQVADREMYAQKARRKVRLPAAEMHGL